MTRDDLDELHALAASISDEAHGWRAHRRQRAAAHAQARAEEERIAPGRRHRRHQRIAFGLIGLFAAGAAAFVLTHRPGHAAPPPKRTIITIHHQPRPVQVGQAAAVQLGLQGRTADIFACQLYYDSQHLAAVPGQDTQAWRADYLAACSTITSTDPSGG
jgi:hypothetical protein